MLKRKLTFTCHVRNTKTNTYINPITPSIGITHIHLWSAKTCTKYTTVDNFSTKMWIKEAHNQENTTARGYNAGSGPKIHLQFSAEERQSFGDNEEYNKEYTADRDDSTCGGRLCQILGYLAVNIKPKIYYNAI